MAWNFSPPSPLPTVPFRFQALERLPVKNHNTALIKPAISEKHLFPCRAARSQEATEEPSSSGSSTRTQLDLLEQLTSSTSPGSGFVNDGDLRAPTIREQLSELIGDSEDEFSLPLGKRLKASVKTISQKRNIKRQAYLNEVSRRNDSFFFATIGAFVILPPVVILAVAILTGYVQLFP